MGFYRFVAQLADEVWSPAYRETDGLCRTRHYQNEITLYFDTGPVAYLELNPGRDGLDVTLFALIERTWEGHRLVARTLLTGERVRRALTMWKLGGDLPPGLSTALVGAINNWLDSLEE